MNNFVSNEKLFEGYLVDSHFFEGMRIVNENSRVAKENEMLWRQRREKFLFPEEGNGIKAFLKRVAEAIGGVLAAIGTLIGGYWVMAILALL